MYSPYEAEIASLFESPEDYEYEERVRRPMRGPVRTPPRGGVVPPRPDAGFATRTELTTAVTRLDGKIATNSTAIQTLDGRVSAIGADLTKLKAAGDQTKRSIDEVRQLAMLLPLLSSQATRKATADVTGTEIKKDEKIVVESSDSFSKLLPVLLLSGGLGGSSSGSSGGQESNNLMPLVLVLALSGK